MTDRYLCTKCGHCLTILYEGLCPFCLGTTQQEIDAAIGYKRSYDKAVGMHGPLIDERNRARARAAAWKACAKKQQSEIKNLCRILVAMDNVSGALVDAGDVEVPYGQCDYGGAVRKITASRDEARAEVARLKKVLRAATMIIAKDLDHDLPGYQHENCLVCDCVAALSTPSTPGAK